MAATAFVYEDSAIALIRTSDGLNKIIAVSYTHLDVYKRQRYTIGC